MNFRLDIGYRQHFNYFKEKQIMCDQTPVSRNIKDDGPLNRYVKRDDVVVEHETLKKLKHKDERALEWFIDRYAAYVNTIIYNIIGLSVSAADIEEVSSDVFFTLWMNAKNISPGKVKAYLGGVARNKAKEYTRKMGTEVLLEDDVILISEENLEQDFEEREQAIFIREAVLAMKDPEREIFLRHYYYYQPITEISKEMGIHASTVKMKLHRGRKVLKEKLIKRGYIIGPENI